MSYYDYFNRGTNTEGKSSVQIIEESAGSGGGTSGDLTNYYTKTQTNSTFASKSELIANYATTAYIDGQLADYRTAQAQDVASETLINQALTTAASQFVEYIYDTRIVGSYPVANSTIPFTQNQISAFGSSVFTKTGNNIVVSAAYGLEIGMQVEFAEDNGNLQRIQITPNWVAGDSLIFQQDNDNSDLNPSLLRKEWVVQTTAGQSLNFAITLTGFNNIAIEWVKIKVIFKTISYNSALFQAAANISISNVQNLQLELNARYIKGQSLDMQGQAISNVGGILLDEGTRITDPDFAINAPVNYNDEHIVPKTIVQQMIDAEIASGGGQSSILSTLGNTTFTVQDSPSILGHLVANNTSILELAISGGQSVWNAGSLLFTTTNNTKHILYDEIANFSSASQYALCPKAYVDSVISGFGDLSNKISYTTDVTATLISDFDIVNKKYVDDAVSGAGAGFDVSNAPLLRYDAGIDSLLIGSDNQNLASVQWVIDNTITGSPQLIERLNQLGNTTYTLAIDNNGRLTYKDTTPKTWFNLDTDASQVLQLNCDLEIQNNYEIIGPSAVSLVTPHTAFADYANTEVVTKEHLQDYIDSVVASGSSNAIVSTASNLQKLVITGDADTTSNLTHTMFATSTGTNTDTLVCQADAGDSNKIKYTFNESWPKLNQSLATIQAQTDPQIIPTKEYIDSLIMPSVSNRKVNTTANNNYSTWTVNHGLNQPLSNLIIQYYIVLTVSRGSHPIGTIFQMHELSYVGNTVTDSFGWQTYSIAGDNNNIRVRMLTAGYGSVSSFSTNSIVSIEYNEADLYCNIISVGNNLISQVQTSLSTQNYTVTEQGGNLLHRHTTSGLELQFTNSLGDQRFSSDNFALRSYNNGLANNPNAYIDFNSQDFSPNAMIVYNNSNLEVIKLLYNGSIQYSGTLQSITASSQEYKVFKLMSDHYEQFMMKPFPDMVWFKYNAEFRDQYAKDQELQIGWIWEALQKWDPENKFKLYEIRDTRDRFGKINPLKTVNEQRVKYFMLAQQQYKIDRLEKENKRLTKTIDAIMARLDALERQDNPKSDVLNQTFDSTNTLKSKLNTTIKKRVAAAQITLK